jgi:hypothetical protein
MTEAWERSPAVSSSKVTSNVAGVFGYIEVGLRGFGVLHT